MATVIRGSDNFDTAKSDIYEVDKWILTVNKSDDTVISANLERAGTSFGFVSLKGTGMSQSSGIFTFPSTGFWMVSASMTWVIPAGDNVGFYIDLTQNNSTYSSGAAGLMWCSNKGSSAASTGMTASDVVKVSNVSLDKIRFRLSSLNSGSYLEGSTSNGVTAFTFIKLGDL
tara:strand:+ start:908 stop:1423 length:516 start_codon:yes stop_codon:yes gene_type:complete